MSNEELDLELSALLDGELSPQRERELRRELEADAQLRERLAAFESVGRRLSALPQPPLPADLRARLQRRIDAAPAPHATRARRSSPRWGVPLAAALAAAAAAGLVATLLIRPLADPAEIAATRPAQLPQLQPAATAKTATTNEYAQPQQAPAIRGAPEPAADAIADASDEELAIAFELATLRDLDMIQQLDLLEALLKIESTEEERG